MTFGALISQQATIGFVKIYGSSGILNKEWHCDLIVSVLMNVIAWWPNKKLSYQN